MSNVQFCAMLYFFKFCFKIARLSCSKIPLRTCSPGFLHTCIPAFQKTWWNTISHRLACTRWDCLDKEQKNSSQRPKKSFGMLFRKPGELFLITTERNDNESLSKALLKNNGDQTKY